ncbi:hypothetical protein EMIT0P294_50042 [Pseudomonas sp. IT-P294]
MIRKAATDISSGIPVRRWWHSRLQCMEVLARVLSRCARRLASRPRLVNCLGLRMAETSRTLARVSSRVSQSVEHWPCISSGIRRLSHSLWSFAAVSNWPMSSCNSRLSRWRSFSWTCSRRSASSCGSNLIDLREKCPCPQTTASTTRLRTSKLAGSGAEALKISTLPSAEHRHNKSMSRRAFFAEGGHGVSDLRLAYIADGANECSLRADPPWSLTGLYLKICSDSLQAMCSRAI